MLLSKLDRSEEEKGDAYVREVSEEIITLALSEHNSNHEKDRKLWDIYHGRRDPDKFKYLTNVDNLTYPAKMRNIGNKIARSKINLLESKQSRRHFRFKAVAIDERSMKKKYENRIKAHINAVKESYEERVQFIDMQLSQVQEKMQEMQEMLQAQPENEEMAMQMQQLQANMPMIKVQMDKMIRLLSKEKLDNVELQKKIDKFLLSTEQELIQQIATASLKSAMSTEDLNEHWNFGLKEKLVTGKPAYIVYYDERIKDVKLRQIDAINVSYSSGGNNKWTQNGEWCAVEERMTTAQIKAEFELTDDQCKLIDGYVGRSSGSISNYYGNSAVFDGNTSSTVNMEGISVWRIWFLSPREVHYKSTPNKHREGELFYNLTSKDYKPKKNEKKHKALIYDCYASVFIGSDLCINLGKQDKVFRPLDIPGLPTLPIVARSFNAMSDKPYSLIESIEELIELYDIVNYKKELTICLAGIRGMIMDKSQKPDDMSTKSWMYYRKMGTMWIETIKKGRKVPATFNQFQNYDDSLSQSVMLYDNILANIDFVMGNIMGVTGASLGQIVKDEAVSNARMSNEQSSLITEIQFHENDKVFTKALDLFLNLKTRFVWNEGKVLNFINKELEEVLIHIPKGLIDKADFRLYTNNNIKQDEQLEDLRQIAIQSWSTSQIPLPSIASIITMEDVVEMEKSLVMFHKEAQELQQQNAMAIESQKGQIEERRIQLEMQMAQQIESIRNQAKEVEMNVEMQKLQFEQSKFDWEAQFKEKELQIKANSEAFKVASENEIESAYLQEEGRANRTNEMLKQMQMRIDAILGSASVEAGEKQSQRKAAVDLDKNMRNKNNIRD